MITKDQALYNITKAYLDYKVASRLFWDDNAYGDTTLQGTIRREYFNANARYDAMGAAYIDCDVLTWPEIDAATSRYKLDRFDAPGQ